MHCGLHYRRRSEVVSMSQLRMFGALFSEAGAAAVTDFECHRDSSTGAV
jgi:hypothetical protein